MNDLLNDINKLKAIQENVASLNGMDFTKKIISDMINEKVNIVSDYEEHIKSKSFDPQFLIDQEVARQDELKIDNKYVA